MYRFPQKKRLTLRSNFAVAVVLTMESSLSYSVCGFLVSASHDLNWLIKHVNFSL